MIQVTFKLYCMSGHQEDVIREAYAGSQFDLGPAETVTGKQAGAPGWSAGTLIQGTGEAESLAAARAAFVAINCPKLINPIVSYLTKYSSPVQVQSESKTA